MTNQDLGYNDHLENHRVEQGLDVFDLGRVVSEHKDRYEVVSTIGEFEAELIGNLRYNSESRSDLPTVGDWVAFSTYDEGKALIHAIYPRYSLLERQAVGKSGQKQLIAANIDFGLIVQAVNRDFNLNRLERYLTLCHAAQVVPVILLSKIDLVNEDELKTLLSRMEERIKEVRIIPLSNLSNRGLSQLIDWIEKGKTYCLLGSSGVGKSTILNKLKGGVLMKTGTISQSIDRGKHVTSHRELVVMETGGIIIDNPGMREVGMTDTSLGLETTFDDIVKLSKSCKFSDCSHVNEKGCAIIAALESGELEGDLYDNYQKMERERMHFESSIEEKRNKDKNFGKMIRTIKKQRKKNKF